MTNELEFVDGIVWASVKWYNGMVGIDVQTGKVEHTVDFERLYEEEMALQREKGVI